jgi:hypothetical protein
MVVLHCNGSTYGNAYLTTFKRTHTRAHTHTHTHTHTLAPSLLSLLEAPAEGFCWNLQEFGPRIPFDGLRGWETCPLEAGNSEIRRVRWLGESRRAASSAKLAQQHTVQVVRTVDVNEFRKLFYCHSYIPLRAQ